MKTSIISDTSSLIILTKLNRLVLLEHIFEKVIIPKRVAMELQAKEDDVYQTIMQSTLFEVVNSKDIELLALLDEVLDYGESEALVLASERKLILLIDEKKGRKIAKSMGIKIIGFLGVLLLNYRHDYLKKKEVEDILFQADQLGFRLSERLKHEFVSKL